jgi:DHA1 family putative efflux transporter-like MFS transporter
VVSLALLPLFSSSPAIGCLLIAVIVLAMFTTAPAIQTFFIQQAPQSANLVLSLQTSIIHLGLAAGAEAGGVMVNAASTVLYNPWLASLIVGLGLVAALACVSLSGRNDAKPAQN